MITPESLAASGTEHGHQCAIFCYCALSGRCELGLLFAVPNGGERNKIVAAQMKAEGVKSGVPDMFLPVARKGYHGLFIELKRPVGRRGPAGVTSTDQDRWIDLLRSQGYAVAVCYGWIEARDCLSEYLE